MCPYHLGILAVLHGLNKDGIAINFHCNHDVLAASSRSGRELACLVGEHGFAYHVHLGVHIAHLLACHVCLGVNIAHFLAVEVGGVACIQWCCLCFGQSYIHSCLVQMSLCSHDCPKVVLLGIAFSQHRPAHVVAHFDGFEPS